MGNEQLSKKGMRLMEKPIETKNKTLGVEKSHKWGVRFMYLLAFTIYTYFMSFDTFFEDSWQPFIIASLAFHLLVPMMILPVDALNRLRIQFFEIKGTLSSDSFSSGSKLAVKDGKLLSFIPESKWAIKKTGGEFGKGFIQSSPAPKEALRLHKEMQEHLSWSRVVIGESRSLNFWFILLNGLTICLPSVHTLFADSGYDLVRVLFASTTWLMVLSYVQVLLVDKLFLRSKMIVAVTDVNNQEKIGYALVDGKKLNSIILATTGQGFEVEYKAVTLNGGLIFGVYRNDVLIEYVVIDGRN